MHNISFDTDSIEARDLPEYQKLGELLKKGRKGTKYTPQDVAEKIGCSNASLILEAETGAHIPFRYLARLVKLYKIPPEPIVELVIKIQERVLRDGFKIQKEQA